MAYETERELDAKGAKRVEGAKEWIARFRSKGIRHLRPRRVAAGSSGWRRARSSGGTVGLRVDVTDLKNKELEIERARADYQSLVDSLSDMVYAPRFQGCLHVRQCRCHRPAGAAGRGRGRPALRRFPGRRGPGDAPLPPRRAHLRSTDDGVRQINLRVKRADGSIRHMECRYRRPPGGPGQTVAAVGVMRDVTERVELAARLERQMAEVEHGRAEYQALLDSLGDVVLKVDPHSNRIVFANAAAAERWGLQMVGADAFDHIASDGPGACARDASGAASPAAGRGSCSCAIASSRPAASTRHVEANCRKVWGLDGKSLIVAIVRDIEDRVRLERRLAEEMGNLRSIVELIGAGVMLDRPRPQGHRGQPRGPEHPRADREGSGRPAGHRDRRDRSRDGRVPAMAGRRAHRPGKVYALAHRCVGPASAVQPDGEPDPRFVGAVRQIAFLGVDDTERRETEQALFAAERLTTVGEMAATVAHELSQPLQVIDLACHSAKDELVRVRRARQCRRSCLHGDQDGAHRPSGRARERASSATSGLSCAAPAPATTPVPFQIAEAVHGAVDLTTHGLRQQQAIAVGVAARRPASAVVGHVGRLEQVLVNLINNARDAGGALHFRRRQRRRARRPARWCASRSRIRARASRPTCCPRLFVALRHHQGARQGHRPRPAHLPPHRRGDGRHR